MRIVHFADLHLDSAFAWSGASGEAGHKRRQALRDVLQSIARLALEVDADALFCGGDLYEHDRVTPDTAAFLQRIFKDLAPIPVFIAPGNHDYCGRDSVYATCEWNDNVHIFREPSLQPIPLADGLTLWGAAHCVPANTGNFLEGFQVEGSGAHIALFHGSERSWLSEQGTNKEPHAPFDAENIADAGLHHAFLGHYHRPKDAERHTYPGNPDPLQFGEDRPNGLDRGPVIATITPDGAVQRERRSVARTQAHDLTLDVTSLASQQDVRDKLAAKVQGLAGVARLTVRGEIEPTLDLRLDALRDVLSDFDAIRIETAELRQGYDLDAIREEQTVKGEFVRDVEAADLDPEKKRRILIVGLRALDGHKDLDVL